MDHSLYDKRRYPVVDVREGYGEWVRTYEQTVEDEMDLRLLDGLQTVDWSAPRCVLDLACGTGRIGAWLRGRCAAAIDGVDMTPAMLEVARSKGVDRTLRVADVAHTGCKASAYADLPGLMERFTAAPSKQLLAVDGGANRGDPCEAFAYHGFNGLERDVVAKIAEFVH